MIARVADHCFWFGRYLERVESTARVLQVTAGLALDAELTPEQCWQPVIITSGEQENFARLCGEGAAGNGEVVQEYLSFRSECPVSIARSVAAARENARSIREVISLEAWESINELHLYLSGGQGREEYKELRYGFYKRVRRDAQLCQGLLRATMLADAPLDFIWLGVLLERLGQTARILDVHHHAFTFASSQAHTQAQGQPGAEQSVVETALWLSLLRACYGFEPFMKIHHGPVTGPAVAAFLIFEKRFPRSVRHCLVSARERLWQIRPPAQLEMPGLRALERLRALDGWLNHKAGERLDAGTVHDLLTQVVDETQAACAEIAQDLLGAPIPPPLQVQTQ
jgi:uncharacterized alpha-E superfamily protein